MPRSTVARRLPAGRTANSSDSETGAGVLGSPELEYPEPVASCCTGPTPVSRRSASADGPNDGTPVPSVTLSLCSSTSAAVTAKTGSATMVSDSSARPGAWSRSRRASRTATARRLTAAGPR